MNIPEINGAAAIAALAGATLMYGYEKVALPLIHKHVGGFFLGRKRTRLRKHAGASIGQAFSLPGIDTDIYVADWEACDGFEPHLIECAWATSMDDVRVPQEYSGAYDKFLQAGQEAVEQGEIFNGETLALQKLRVGRVGDGPHERSQLRLGFSRTNYLHHRAVGQIFQSLPDSERQKLVQQPDENVSRFFSNSFGTSVAVISKDRKLVFAKRSGSTAVNSGKIICGAVEGMNCLDINERQKPDPYVTAIRGLSEELGIEVHPKHAREMLSFMAITFDMGFYEWGMIAVLDMSNREQGADLTADEISHYRNIGKPRDKWESSELEFVDFNPKSVLQYLRENNDRLTGYAKFTTVCALVKSYGWDGVLES